MYNLEFMYLYIYYTYTHTHTHEHNEHTLYCTVLYCAFVYYV